MIVRVTYGRGNYELIGDIDEITIDNFKELMEFVANDEVLTPEQFADPKAHEDLKSLTLQANMDISRLMVTGHLEREYDGLRTFEVRSWKNQKKIFRQFVTNFTEIVTVMVSQSEPKTVES